MKNTTMFIILIIIIAGGIFLFSKETKSSNQDITGSIIKNNNIQKITLSIKDYNYYPNTIKVKAGVPVRINLDKSVVGCYRSFTIRDLGVVKYAKTPEDKIIFTPKKTGSFRFACSMGMGTGTIIVEWEVNAKD